MAVGDAYQLSLLQTFAGQRMMNTLAFDRKAETPPTVAEGLALANTIKDAWRVHQTNGVAWTGWVLQQVSGAGVTYDSATCKRAGGIRLDGLFTGILLGSLTGEGLPPQIAAVTTLKTGLAGRSRRGRYYMLGLEEASQANGQFLGSATTIWQGIWDSLLAKYSGTGTDLVWRIGVWSHTIASGCKPGAAHPHPMTSFAPPSPGTAFTPVTSFVVRSICFTQRRRTIGIGS